MFNIFLLKILLFKIFYKLKKSNKNSNELFERSRFQLASWYAGLLSVVLGISGLIVYEAIAYSQRLTIDQELETIANNLHETLEPILQEPGQLEAIENDILPPICLVAGNCYDEDSQKIIKTARYYMSLLDASGNTIAIIGDRPSGLANGTNEEWQDLQDSKGNRYRQISLMLHNQKFENWGYLQVARPLHDLDRYIKNLQIILLMGLPGILLLLIAVSWWLSGKAMQPIYQSYQLLQQFTADAAHELNTPLAATRATVESLLMMPNFDEKEARETLQTVRRQNLRVSNLVANLLLLCRIDRQLTMNSYSEIDGEKIDLNNLINDIAEDFAALALASEIDLNLVSNPSENLIAIGNYEQLYRLVANLVSNALKYTPAKGKVTLSLDRRANYALIRVCDTGIGIAPLEQNKIFDRFYRVDTARSRATGGSGLGLSIARVIARSHRGKIEVESKPSQGSTFTIFLPIK
ncbi:MAG: two-component system sensor histidine kinase RppB [Prochloraceae cyanobacterium]